MPNVSCMPGREFLPARLLLSNVSQSIIGFTCAVGQPDLDFARSLVRLGPSLVGPTISGVNERYRTSGCHMIVPCEPL